MQLFTTRSITRASLFAALVVVMATSPTLSQVQSTAQRRCIIAMNRAFDRVGRAQATVHKECVALAQQDKLAPQTLQDCLQSDPRGEVAEAQSETLAAEAQYCSTLPDFGYTDGATVNAAAVIDEQQMIYGLFGPNINNAIIPKSADPQRAQCLTIVVRGVERIMKKKRIEFKRCKNEGLQDGTITSEATLAQCYEDVAQDVRQKIVKPIQWLEEHVANYCAGVNLDATFPGRCVGAPDYTDCANDFTDCRMCVSQNTADDLNEDCDLYDNGVNDNSCQAVTCGNNVVEINEDCDDANTLNGDCCSSTCQYEVSGSACTDGNVCTNDTCDGAGTCVPTPNTDPCNDGVFCNGADTCAGSTCSVHAGDPCTSGTECADTCNESADDCFDLAGATCGSPLDDECTNPDTCNGAGACLANHESTSAPCGDTGTDCTNQDLCDGAGGCADSGFQPAGTACTSDGNVCTDDECDGAGTCDHNNNTAPCNDSLFCNGADTCAGGTCSVHAGDPCPGPDGDGNCAESCDESSDTCTAADLFGSACDDGLFCNGTDQCSGGNCTIHAGDPCPGADGDVNCAESCNEAGDNCLANDPDGSVCASDSDVCTSDQCSSGTCAHPYTTNCKFVTPIGSGTACTTASPCSLTQGLSSVSGGFEVRMGSGTYSVNNEITNLNNNVTLRGGFDAGTWAQTAGCTASVIARDASNPDGTTGTDLRIAALDLTSKSGFSVDCLKIETSSGTSGTGMSTYGAHLNSASNYLISNVTITPGAAGSGVAGSTGGTGASGTTAANGTAGLADGSTARGGGNGSAGAGGGGGPLGSGATTGAGANGTASTNTRAGGGGGGGGGGGFHGTGGAGGQGGGVNGGANQTNVGSGGPGGNCSTAGGTGGAGGDGLAGTVGSTGTTGAAGTRSTYWLNGLQAGTGGDGSGGKGGTGGGGGGGQDDPGQPGPSPTCIDGVGAGGGGGGGGGQGGTGGSGGRGGGSSYGIYLTANGAGGVINNSTLITAGAAGAGGAGGTGGSAGTGGTRGSGGTAAAGVGAGGNGGFGGNGANGGTGGVGAAGESVSIVTQSGTAPTINP